MANFKTAIETTLFAKSALEDALKSSADLGFDTIEIGLSHFDACRASSKEREVLSETLNLYGLRLGALFALAGWDPSTWTKSSFGISAPEERVRAAAVSQMKRALVNADKLGCKLVLSELDGDMDKRSKSLTSFQKSVGELLPELEGRGIRLAFEAHPGDFIEDSFEATDLLSSFAAKSIGYNYCIAHTFVLRHSPSEIVKRAGRLTCHVHYADTMKPERIFFCPTYKPKVVPHLHLQPGLGDVDFNQTFRSLKEEGFDGYLAVHPFSHLDDPLPAARMSKEKLETTLSQL